LRRGGGVIRAALGAAAACAFLFAGHAVAENVEDEIAGAQADVRRLEDELRRLDAEIARLEGQARTAAQAHRIAERRWQQAAREVSLHRSRLRLVVRRLARERAEAARLGKALDHRRGLLSQRAVALWKRARRAEYEVLVSSADLVDLGRRTRFLGAIARADADLVGRTLEAKTAVEASARRLAGRKAEMDGVQRDLDRAAARERRARDEARAAKARLDRETAAARRRRADVARDVQNLRGLVVRLQERLRGIQGVARAGRLARPVRGEIFIPEEISGVLGGAYIRAPHGAPVGAAAPGRVVHVGPLRGFGTTVLIGHADEVVTVYGNLSEATTAPGREVAEGTTIGRVGTSHYGSALYFAVRARNAAQDPRLWLQE
jgi:septal ring factor EnvC (AmiA/AmiB activator)